MTERDRLILLMRKEGKTFREIASALGMCYQRVQQIYYRETVPVISNLDLWNFGTPLRTMKILNNK